MAGNVPGAMMSFLRAHREDKYLDYADLNKFLTDLSLQCGGVLRHFSIGQSVQGKELWGVRLTDNPDVHEYEPEFLYIGNIHGDETMSRELLIHFALDICDRYVANDKRIQWLVHNTDIYILFSANPDGFQALTRWNHNGWDLNRNFPDQVKGASPDTQPETTAIVNFLQQHSFSLGANLHAGSLVCNYPWDGRSSGELSVKVPSYCPDEALYHRLCRLYSEVHPEMHLSSVFKEGMTNGANYFTIYGGLQDYAYSQVGMVHVTLELGIIKNPPASTIPDVWKQNSEALYAYMEQVHTGVKGIVQCACMDGGRQITTPAEATLTFTPLAKASEEPAVSPMAQVIRTRTRPDLGNYHRVLLPGAYAVAVEGCGGAAFSGRLVVPEAVLPPGLRGAGPPALVADFTLQRSCDLHDARPAEWAQAESQSIVSAAALLAMGAGLDQALAHGALFLTGVVLTLTLFLVLAARRRKLNWHQQVAPSYCEVLTTGVVPDHDG